MQALLVLCPLPLPPCSAHDDETAIEALLARLVEAEAGLGAGFKLSPIQVLCLGQTRAC